jgi:hypothetical protein
MVILITLLLYILAILVMVGLRISRSPISYSWMSAALGALFAWASILAWQVNLPFRIHPSLWAPVGLFGTSPELLVDSYAWLYALSLSALAVAVVLTSPARTTSAVNPAAWAGSLAISAIGLSAILADNPLTLVLAWTAIDLTEFLYTLRASDSPSLSERTVISFAIRASGTGLVLWASVLISLTGQSLLFENVTSLAGIFLLLAVGLRLGVIPLHLAYRSEPILRRGFGTTLRLMAAATSLIVLARIPATALNPTFVPYILGLVAFAAIYGAWNWLIAKDELIGRPFWIIGMSAIALAANLSGNSAGSAAWGAALILFGGISFLYSARRPLLSRILAGLGLFLLGLPFTLTANGWSGTFPLPGLFWPLFLAAHLMLVAGYLRHLFSGSDTSYAELPTWAQAAYPIGLAFLAITILVLGVWGWVGALQVQNWIPAVILLVLLVLVGFAYYRFRRFAPGETRTGSFPQFSWMEGLLKLPGQLFWTMFRFTARTFEMASNLLEGDGGLLWTLLLLVLLISVMRGQ